MKVEKYRFIHTIQVRYADTDAQGHVYFSNYLTYFDEAHTAYLREIGFPWSKLVDTGYTINCAIYMKGSDELIAGGYITAVVVTPETRQPTRVPDEIRQAVAVYEGRPCE
jgi:acyl-CoA thioester hydrolase